MEMEPITTTTVKEDNNLLLVLPIEITTEIFSRLPAESVMRCKRVCKIWRAFIIDPAFINMHYSSHYTMNTTTATEIEWVSFPTKVVPHDFSYQLQLVKYNNDDTGCDDEDEKINPNKQSKQIIYGHMTITYAPTIKKIGLCNGLIFMTKFVKNLVVCNPFTREYVILPLRFNTPRFLGDFSSGAMWMTSGFGYHSSTNEYKVVMIYYSNRSSYLKGHVAIYTLGSGEWRDKGQISHRVIDGARNAGGVLFNGALHWLTEKMDEIVSFDLADEEFRIVPSPISQFDDYVPQLGLLGGCLYVTKKRNEDRNEDPAQRSTDIWVMDSMEYSWGKKFNISWKSGLSNHRPLALLKSGRILLHRSGGYLISYDPESSIVVDKSFCKFTHVYTYTKTFVSLKALGETDARYM